MQEIKYKGKYITVTEENINGHTFERVRMRSGVNVIPYRDGKIMLIHEDRVHENGTRWKLISGWIDKDDRSILDHAKEELAEEVGYRAGKWLEIYNGDFDDRTISTGLHFYVCEGLSELDNPIENPDDSIVIEKKWFSFDDIFNMMTDRKVSIDPMITVALAFLYKENKKSD